MRSWKDPSWHDETHDFCCLSHICFPGNEVKDDGGWTRKYVLPGISNTGGFAGRLMKIKVLHYVNLEWYHPLSFVPCMYWETSNDVVWVPRCSVLTKVIFSGPYSLSRGFYLTGTWSKTWADVIRCLFFIVSWAGRVFGIDMGIDRGHVTVSVQERQLTTSANAYSFFAWPHNPGLVTRKWF